MHPRTHALMQPDKPAYIMAGSGEVVTYRELNDRSNQGAQLFRSLGLERGDVVAVCLENHPRYLEIAWATQRSGLYIVCISSKLTAPEAEYIVRDCGAKVFITSIGLQTLAEQIAPALGDITLFMVGGTVGPWRSWERACGSQPSVPISNESTCPPTGAASTTHSRSPMTTTKRPSRRFTVTCRGRPLTSISYCTSAQPFPAGLSLPPGRRGRCRRGCA